MCIDFTIESDNPYTATVTYHKDALLKLLNQFLLQDIIPLALLLDKCFHEY